MNISSGKIVSAQKIVLYGPEGIGKSTFAAQFPDPVFIDTEGSTKHMDVRRFDAPTSWEMLLSQIEFVINTKPCKTLVLDTIDWAEHLCTVSVCAGHNWKSIEQPGYGSGYRYVYEEMGLLLNRLNDVIEAGINVVLTAHSALCKFEQPDEMGSYDRYEMKLQNSRKCNTAAMVKEWADMVLFANYKTIVIKEGNGDSAKNKAQGGKRVMYTSHHSCWDAKNRHGLSEELPFQYAQIAHCITDANPIVPPASPAPVLPAQTLSTASPPPAVETAPVTVATTAPVQSDAPAAERVPNIPAELPAALRDLMKINSVDEKEIRTVVSHKGYYPYEMPISKYDPDFINGAIIAGWQMMLPLILSNRDLPF